jgi:hypothetical protein
VYESDKNKVVLVFTIIDWRKMVYIRLVLFASLVIA